jgi:hypothetical protein
MTPKLFLSYGFEETVLAFFLVSTFTGLDALTRAANFCTRWLRLAPVRLEVVLFLGLPTNRFSLDGLVNTCSLALSLAKLHFADNRHDCI